jgi:hypothetical protein
MSPEELDSELTALLHPECEAVPDAGFSCRVARALPRRRAGWLRHAILLGMTFIGCLLGLVIFSGGEFVKQALARISYTEWVIALPLPWLLLAYFLSWAAVASAVDDRSINESSTG